MLQIHVAALKEPRGFIKVFQFVFAILALTTTVGFSTFFSFHATVEGCQSGSVVVKQNVNYPFALDSEVAQWELCQTPSRTVSFHFATDTSSAAELFVSVGVVSMLYAMAALAVYVLLSEIYSGRYLPTADFLVHAGLALLWLVAASAWANGASTLKSGCDPQDQLKALCGQMQGVKCDFLNDDSSGTFGKLNASLIFGFLNTFLWAANLWFLWKETPWFSGRQSSSATGAAVTTSNA